MLPCLTTIAVLLFGNVRPKTAEGLFLLISLFAMDAKPLSLQALRAVTYLAIRQ
jgi:hypothetical protein